MDLNNRLNIGFYLVIVLLSQNVSAQPLNNSVVDRAVNFLSEATAWSITDGVREYYAKGLDKEWIQEKTRLDWAVSTYSGPIIDSERYNSRFMLAAAGISFDIISLVQFEESQLYEYWLVKKSAVPGVEFTSSCEFLITVAEDNFSKREILFKSNTFFSSYQISDETNLTLPLDDLRLLYDLSAWTFPDCYPDSDLMEYWVIPQGGGEYTKEKMSLWDKFLLKLQGV